MNGDVKSDTSGPGLIPRFPAAVWTVLVGDAVSAFGQGMSLPFLVIYLHDVRGIDLSTAGLVLSTVALVSFIGNPVGGWLSDPLGPRTTLMFSLACCAVGVAMFAPVTSAPPAFVAGGLLGLGNAVAWPAFDALLAEVAGPSRRSAAFSLRHATMNAGLALGAVVAGLIIDTAHPGSFQLVYVVDAVTFVLFIPLLMTIPARRGVRSPTAPDGNGGYRAVLADRRFLSVVALSALIVTVGVSQYHAAFPVWATRNGGIPVSALGACYAANALTVILGQLPMLRAVTGRRRTTAVSIACVAWAISWGSALIFGSAVNGWLATVGFICTMVVFGVGETALAPTLAAMVNDLAPDDLRGRYNGVSALGWTTGFFLGPAISGMALDANAGTALLIVLSAACLASAWWASALGRQLPESANHIAP
jgi:MFS family permease